MQVPLAHPVENCLIKPTPPKPRSPCLLVQVRNVVRGKHYSAGTKASVVGSRQVASPLTLLL
jgi:hypothetical protein